MANCVGIFCGRKVAREHTLGQVEKMPKLHGSNCPSTIPHHEVARRGHGIERCVKENGVEFRAIRTLSRAEKLCSLPKGPLPLRPRRSPNSRRYKGHSGPARIALHNKSAFVSVCSLRWTIWLSEGKGSREESEQEETVRLTLAECTKSLVQLRVDLI